MLTDELEDLAKRHGATSYRNRADTKNPAYGFTESGLGGLVAEVRAQDESLIRQLTDITEALIESDSTHDYHDAVMLGRIALKIARARLQKEAP